MHEEGSAPQRPADGPEARGWSIDFGWSIDVARVGRVGTLLVAALTAVITGVTPVQAAGYDPASDPYSMAATTAGTGATAWWNAGYTGAGVDVALIDTGVSPVVGLDGAGKLVNGPDLSFESQASNLRYLDTNGHGTFMAGLIAGNSPDYKGMAPDARIVSLKVSTADGGTDVSQVIAAIDWVVQHKADHGLNIRVINLSYGTNSSPTAADTDPLSFAAEQAWHAGIVVVAAVGNDRYTNRGQPMAGLSNPASNPFVISVGALDTMGTPSTSDDIVAPFSTKNNLGCRDAGCKNPDFVAPGTHLQGLRVPGGYVDQTHPEGRIDDRYFRGSGASQATAIASGAVALLLQRFPNATPDQVRKQVKRFAPAVSPGYGTQSAGAGQLSLTKMLGKGLPDYVNTANPSTGTGTLEGARGTDHLTTNGVVLSGEQDVFGHPFDSAAMAAAEAAGSSWSGGTWNGSSWSGSSWSGSSWSGNSWSGSSWSGSSWSGSSWSGSSWSGSSWSGSSWSGSSWSGSSWSGSSWSGSSWSGTCWATGSWD